MSDIENIQPGDNITADDKAPVRTRKALTKTEKLQDILLVVSVAQLILAFALYMVAVINIWWVLLISVIIAGLAVLSYFKFDRRTPRIIIRILCISFAAVPFVLGAVYIASLYFEAVKTNDPDVMQYFLSLFWLTFTVGVLSPLLFLQPVFVMNATARRRFDMVMLRIVTIATFACSIILCVFALEFKIDDGQLLNTSTTYAPVIFGEQINFTLAIDTVITRILFCALGAAMIVCSFLVRSKKKDKQPVESAKNSL